MKKSIVFLFAAAVIMIAGSSSCNLDNSSTNPPVCQFGFLQASPDAPNVDVYANGGIVALNLPYAKDTGYFVAAPGTYNFLVAPTSTTTYIVNTNITFAPAVAYSVFTIDSLSKIKTAVVVDSFLTPSADSVRVRFFHFSPNAPSVDLGVTGITAPWYGSRTFNDQSTTSSWANFAEIPAGTYNLEVRAAGTSTVLASAPGTVLQGGKVYTFYLKGFDGGTGAQALGIGIINNN